MHAAQHYASGLIKNKIMMVGQPHKPELVKIHTNILTRYARTFSDYIKHEQTSDQLYRRLIS